METLDKIIQRLIQNFAFLEAKGYLFQSPQVFNKDKADKIFARLIMVNEELERLLVFDIYPRQIIEIDVFVTDTAADQSMDLKSYVEFKKGGKPKYTPAFIIDGADLIYSVDKFSDDIRHLLETDLKDVIGNMEWITFPTYNPKDDY